MRVAIHPDFSENWPQLASGINPPFAAPHHTARNRAPQEGIALDRQVGYPIDVIEQTPGAGTWVLGCAFDADTMLWQVSHGPKGCVVRDATGQLLAEGMMTADIPLVLDKPGGGTIRLERVEVGGMLRLFMSSERLTPGVSYAEAAPAWSGGRPASPEEMATLPGLGTGTMIATDDGPQPIDWLRPGDRILTRDNGYQPLLWLDRQTIPRRAPPDCRPITLAADGFGEALPERAILASPGLGVLLAGHELDLWFGEREMFALARDLAPQAPAADGRQHLYSLLLPAPEIILAEGMWVSSVHADPAFMAHLPDRVRGVLVPRLATPHARAARGWLDPWEVAMFRRARVARSRRIAA
jgi:hypothetical protein